MLGTTLFHLIITVILGDRKRKKKLKPGGNKHPGAKLEFKPNVSYSGLPRWC